MTVSMKKILEVDKALVVEAREIIEGGLTAALKPRDRRSRRLQKWPSGAT
jgi:hypothetical protein